MEKEKIRGFVEQWFCAVPTDLVSELMSADYDSWTDLTVRDDGCEVYDIVPMWGTMWTFRWPDHEEWARTEEGRQALSRCGFTILEHDERVFIGIDGAGYDFISAHWAPLFREMGL